MKENSKNLLKELSAGRTLLASRPAALHLETVRGCQSACCMCEAARDHSPPVKISPQLLEKIEPYFADLEYLAIHGLGEPLLGDLEYFVQQAVRHDFVCHMNSTGFHLTPDKINLLLQARLSIRFSVHAGQPATYRRIMGKDLDHTISKISDLVKASLRQGKDNEFWFCFVVMKENIAEIPDFLRLAHDCGITTVRFSPLAPNRDTVAGVYFKERDFKFIFREQWNSGVHKEFIDNYGSYQNQARALGIRLECDKLLSYSDLLTPHPRLYFAGQFLPFRRITAACLAPWLGQFNIRIDGKVQLCCSSTARIGNLHEASLGQIWNSPLMQRVRKQFSKKRYPYVCGSCRGYGFSNLPQNTALAKNHKTPQAR